VTKFYGDNILITQVINFQITCDWKGYNIPFHCSSHMCVYVSVCVCVFVCVCTRIVVRISSGISAKYFLISSTSSIYEKGSSWSRLRFKNDVGNRGIQAKSTETIVLQCNIARK